MTMLLDAGSDRSGRTGFGEVMGKPLDAIRAKSLRRRELQRLRLAQRETTHEPPPPHEVPLPRGSTQTPTGSRFEGIGGRQSRAPEHLIELGPLRERQMKPRRKSPHRISPRFSACGGDGEAGRFPAP